jgi:hypothetical protein
MPAESKNVLSLFQADREEGPANTQAATPRSNLATGASAVGAGSTSYVPGSEMQGDAIASKGGLQGGKASAHAAAIAEQQYRAAIDAAYLEPNVVALDSGHRVVVKSVAGLHYKVRQLGTVEQPTAVTVSNNVIVTRTGDALLLRYGDDSTVLFENFYGVCRDSSLCSVNVVGPTQAGFYLAGDSAVGNDVVGKGETLIYAHGNTDVLMAMAQSQAGLTEAFSLFAHAPQLTYWPYSYSGATAGAGLSGGAVLAGLVGAAALGGGGGGGGSGGGASAANTSTAAQTPTDTTAPTVPTVVLGSGVANGATATEALAATGIVMVTAESGAKTAVTFTGSRGTVTKTVTGTGAAAPVVLTAAERDSLGQGEVSVTAVATDTAGNTSPASPATRFTLDTMAPAAPTLVTGPGVVGDVSAAEAIAAMGVVTVNAEAGASTAVTFTGTNGTVVKTVAGTGAASPVVLTAAERDSLGQGEVSVAAVATDAAGNASQASPATRFSLDTTAPATPTLAMGPGAVGNVSAAEAIAATGVVTVNAEAGASTAVTFTGTSGAVTKTVTGTGAALAVELTGAERDSLGQGAVGVSAVATDAAGNSSSAGSGGFTLDTRAPTVGIAMADTALRVGETSVVTFTFSEAVTGFSNADITLAGGTLSAVGSTDGGVTWTGTFRPTDNVEATTNLIAVTAASYTDLAGNTGGAGSSANYTVDTVAPTLDITRNVAGTASGPVVYTFTFDQAVTLFDSSDVSVTNGTKGLFTTQVEGKSYTLVVTPPSGAVGTGAGTMSVSVGEGAAFDSAGNGSGADTESQLYQVYAGRSTISLGSGNGALIAPLTQDGKTYYFWDRNGDGNITVGDKVDHNLLDSLFNKNLANSTSGDGNTTNDFRFGELAGVKMALLTSDELNALNITYSNNGWQNANYWSATHGGGQTHASVLPSASTAVTASDLEMHYVAFQVLN